MTRNVATLREVDEYYDLVEVADANEALDIMDEAERRAHDPAGGKT